jgi:hypothetical protein
MRVSLAAFVVAFGLVPPLADMVSGFVFHLGARFGQQSGSNCILNHQDRLLFHFKTEARCARQKTLDVCDPSVLRSTVEPTHLESY